MPFAQCPAKRVLLKVNAYFGSTYNKNAEVEVHATCQRIARQRLDTHTQQ
jgi:hypothetical protein